MALAPEWVVCKPAPDKIFYVGVNLIQNAITDILLLIVLCNLPQVTDVLVTLTSLRTTSVASVECDPIETKSGVI